MTINDNARQFKSTATSGVHKIGKSGFSLFSNFSKFINRGNVVDLAVGIAIGAAFTAIINSLVADIFTPIIALAGSGSMAFSEKYVLLRDGKNKTGSYTTLAAAKEAGAITLNYGNFVQTIINFLLIAFILFFIIQLAQTLYSKKTDEKTEGCPYCLEKIPKGAKKCKFCASQLTVSPVVADQASEAFLGENQSEASLLHKRQ